MVIEFFLKKHIKQIIYIYIYIYNNITVITFSNKSKLAEGSIELTNYLFNNI